MGNARGNYHRLASFRDQRLAVQGKPRRSGEDREALLLVRMNVLADDPTRTTAPIEADKLAASCFRRFGENDLLAGEGRARESPRPVSTACHAAALARIMPPISSREKLWVSRPHSGQGRRSTQVQSL